MNRQYTHSPATTSTPTGVVRLNSVVEYEEIPIGPRRTIKLVVPASADERESRISSFAPMGRALLGVHVGSIVDVPLPDGNSLCVQVMAVRSGAEVAP
jgi:regulator of nucleoside diphosphate kinase